MGTRRLWMQIRTDVYWTVTRPARCRPGATLRPGLSCGWPADLGSVAHAGMFPGDRSLVSGISRRHARDPEVPSAERLTTRALGYGARHRITQDSGHTLYAQYAFIPTGERVSFNLHIRANGRVKPAGGASEDRCRAHEDRFSLIFSFAFERFAV